MTPEERQLIAGLFDRMRNYSLPEKDGEAEALIDEQVRTVPDASYMLVQSVLVQEQALQEAGSRIAALEEQMRRLENAQQRPSGTGSFLGGLFGRPAAEPARGPSVPVIGARATPPVYAGGQPGQPGAQPPAKAGIPPAQAAASGGGGFLRTAMTTAAGVAGGMLIAGAIRDLISPAHANPTNATPDAAGSGTSTPTGEAATTEPAPATREVVDEDSSWFGGDGGDFDL